MVSLGWHYLVRFTLALGATLHAATYEVAQQNPQASDDGPGTTERPWKTLQALGSNTLGPHSSACILPPPGRLRLVAGRRKAPPLEQQLSQRVG
jgi:hypothetical protein